MKNPRCLFYAHDGYGMGHIGRSTCLAGELKRRYKDWDVLITTGDKHVFPMMPHQVELVKLPSFVKLPDSDNSPQMKPAALGGFALTLTLRKRLLNTVFETYIPKVVVVDYSVRGLGRELSGTLDVFKEKFPECILILGLRGVLGKKDHIANEVFTTSNLDFIKDYYDTVFVYTDKKIIDVAAYYELPSWLKDRLFYTGYVTSPDDCKLKEVNENSHWGVPVTEPYLGVGLGSGVGAENILKKILAALAATKGLPEKKVIVTGPKISWNFYKQMEIQYPQFIFHHYLDDYASFVAHASIFIGLAGYNTISHWLKQTNPALFIARDQERGEQQLHLQALERLNLCIAIDEKDADYKIFAEKLQQISKNSNHKHTLMTNGEAVAADYINKLR
jgi:predicted glycosyltransferase